MEFEKDLTNLYEPFQLLNMAKRAKLNIQEKVESPAFGGSNTGF